MAPTLGIPPELLAVPTRARRQRRVQAPPPPPREAKEGKRSGAQKPRKVVPRLSIRNYEEPDAAKLFTQLFGTEVEEDEFSHQLVPKGRRTR